MKLKYGALYQKFKKWQIENLETLKTSEYFFWVFFFWVFDFGYWVKIEKSEKEKLGKKSKVPGLSKVSECWTWLYNRALSIMLSLNFSVALILCVLVLDTKCIISKRLHFYHKKKKKKKFRITIFSNRNAYPSSK